MCKILITGAAGFIGSQLAYNLWKNGNEVVLIDNFSYGFEDNLIFEEHDFRKEIQRIDVCNTDKLNEIFERESFDYVYHIAAITPLPDCQNNPIMAMNVNVSGTVNVLESSRKYGVKNVIFASTSAIYENCKTFPTREFDVVQPSLIYSSSKFCAEQMCKSYSDVYGMNITVLRFANVYGPHIDCLRTQPPVVGYITRELYYNRIPVLHSTGEQRRDFIYVDDLIDLAVKVKDNNGFDIFNVSSNETHSINELYRCIVKAMNREDVEPIYKEPSHYWINYPELYEGAYPIRNDILNNEVNKYTLCDNSKAYEKYKWKPRVSFEEGVARTVEFAVKKLSEANNIV
jgi:UDP-glucose 4-epimerase